jgi:glutathione S-transferase
MPKLYYTPTSCGAASFISAFTAGLPFEAEQVDLKTHLTASGKDFYAINPKGNVPALVLDDGTVLNENTASLAYIADASNGKVGPPANSPARYELVSVLSYIASEVHANFGPLFYPVADAVKERARENLAKKFTFIQDNLLKDGKRFLVGGAFSSADAYLYIVLSWTGYVNIDLKPYPVLEAYFHHIKELPNVKDAHARIATSPATTF